MWSSFRMVNDQLFNFLVFATLTRLLMPAQFGVFVLALGIAEAGKVIAQGGLASVLFRCEKVTRELADTIFWTNVVAGLAIAALCYGLRHPLAAALGTPEAADVIGVIGLVAPIAAAGASHTARNLREFGHRALAIRSVLGGVIGGGLAVAAALAGWGVWALVVQRLVSELIGTIVAWWSFRWLPGGQFSWRVLRQQLPLGGSVATSQLLAVALLRVQDLIVSRMIGLSQVGIYRTAWKSIDVIAQGTIMPFASVAAPTLLKLKHDMDAFRSAYVGLISTSAIISFPAIAGVGALADDLIPLLFGSSWSDSVPIARILSLLVLPYALSLFLEPALVVLGQARLSMQMTMLQLALTIVFCVVSAPYGLIAFTLAYVARTYLTSGIQLFLLQRHIGLSAVMLLKSVAPPLFAAVGMVGVLAVVRSVDQMEAGGDLAAILRIVRMVAIGAPTYGLLLLLFSGREGQRKLQAFSERVGRWVKRGT